MTSVSFTNRLFALAGAFALAITLICCCGASSAWAVEATGTTAHIAATGAGTVSLACNGTTGESVAAAKGSTVTVSATPDASSYLAQVRYAVETASATGTTTDSFTAVTPDANGAYTFTMPAGNVVVYADFVSIIWDGTMDITWYDPETTTFTLTYPAQFAGLAAIVNGIFTTYPTAHIEATDEAVAHDVPDYAAFKSGMGVVEDADGKQLGSNLYGTFTATYTLTDSQVSYAEFTEPITKTARVIGDPQYLVANSSIGSKNPNNLVTTSTYWYGNDDFDGKTVYLGADMNFGATKTSSGTWSTESPLFMSLGGQYAMLPGYQGTNGWSVIGSSWNGKLDGRGHRLTNVYAERYASGSNFGDSQSCGIVGRLGNHDGDSVEKAAVNPTVRQIVLESGYISCRRSTGGIVGKIGQTSATRKSDGSIGGIIEYCVNKADVICTDKKGVAGICGAAWNKGVVRYCANFGSITCTSAGSGFLAGGIVGSCEVTVSNCYNVGTVRAGESRYSEAIGSNNGGAVWKNCYYLAGSDGNTTSPGTYMGSGAATAFGPSEALTAPTAELLNNSGPAIWKNDTQGINAAGGVNYPALYFQEPSFDPTENYSITLVQPDEGGTVGASTTVANYGDTVFLSNAPTEGWILEKYLVDGADYTSDQLVIDRNVTVSAVFRQRNRATFEQEDDTEKDWTLSVTKTGLALVDERVVAVEDAPVTTGDVLFEGDVLSFTGALKEGAAPADVDRYYTGNFSYSTSIVSQGGTTISRSGATYTVTSTDASVSSRILSAGTAYKNWLTEADTSWYDPEDPQENYRIATAQQLAGVAQLTRDGVTFEGATLTLTADIDLANADGTTGTRIWAPIGLSNAAPFCGVLEGANHAVTNMTIANSLTGVVSSYRGLVGYLVGGTVRNLTVAGAITSSTSTNYGGGIAAYVEGGTVEGCTSSVDVSTSTTGSTYLGGLVGYGKNATVSNCVNKGALTVGAKSLSANTYVGGIMGNGTADTGSTTLFCCANKGSISGYVCYSGGLMGYCSGPASLSSCYSTGAVTSLLTVTSYAGGLVGYLANNGNADSPNLGQSLTDCYAAGAVSAKSPGAIIGYAYKGRIVLGNVHYLEGIAEAVCGATYKSVTSDSVLTAAPQTAAALKALAPTLGEHFAANTAAGDNAFPLLAFETQAPVGIVGDINNNGLVNIVDAQAVYELAISPEGSSLSWQTVLAFFPEGTTLEQVKRVADVNADDAIDAADAHAIQYFVHNGAFGSVTD